MSFSYSLFDLIVPVSSSLPFQFRSTPGASFCFDIPFEVAEGDQAPRKLEELIDIDPGPQQAAKVIIHSRPAKHDADRRMGPTILPFLDVDHDSTPTQATSSPTDIYTPSPTLQFSTPQSPLHSRQISAADSFGPTQSESRDTFGAPRDVSFVPKAVRKNSLERTRTWAEELRQQRMQEERRLQDLKDSTVSGREMGGVHRDRGGEFDRFLRE